MRYIKKIDNKIEEAPSVFTSNTGMILGYNKSSNESRLLLDGYLRYDGTNPLEYVDIIDNQIIELQYPPVNTIKSNNEQYLYNQKCDVAYTGILVIKDNNTYVFETNSTSIGLITSTLLVLSSASDSTIVNWKTYLNEFPVVIPLSKLQLTTLYGFGMNMINESFLVEGTYLAELSSMTDEQLCNTEYMIDFRNRASASFNNINKTITLQQE